MNRTPGEISHRPRCKNQIAEESESGRWLSNSNYRGIWGNRGRSGDVNTLLMRLIERESEMRMLDGGIRGERIGRRRLGVEVKPVARSARAGNVGPEVDTRFSYHLHEETDRGRVKYDISGVPGRGKVKAPRYHRVADRVRIRTRPPASSAGRESDDTSPPMRFESEQPPPWSI